MRGCARPRGVAVAVAVPLRLLSSTCGVCGEFAPPRRVGVYNTFEIVCTTRLFSEYLIDACVCVRCSVVSLTLSGEVVYLYGPSGVTSIRVLYSWHSVCAVKCAVCAPTRPWPVRLRSLSFLVPRSPVSSLDSALSCHTALGYCSWVLRMQTASMTNSLHTPVPPTLATRGSLLRGAWEPRVQTAPQEPKSPMPHFARGEGARAREVPCHLVNVVIVAKEQGGQHPTASPTASGMHFGGAQARRAAMGNGTKRHRATRDAEAGQG